jgi:hypothetical protein
VTIGIRREDPGRIWERRCPLTPEAVDTLVKKERARVLVQDCDRRVFGVEEFVKVCIILLLVCIVCGRFHGYDLRDFGVASYGK